MTLRKLLFILVFLPTILFSQDLNKTIDSIDLSKTELYGNALTFFANAFVSSNDVIQMKDQITGRIIGKGILKSDTQNRKIKITIDVKDYKYRYSIEIEPFIELKTYNIESINRLGSMIKGNTYIRYGYVNGEHIIDKDNSYFECRCSGKWRFYYSGKNEFMGLSKTAQSEWRHSVDNFLSQNINNLLEKSTGDLDLISLIEYLEKTMSIKNNW